LVAEARALLEAAQRREVVEADRARAFAKACAEASPMGRLVLGVLDGGPFLGRRLVELASLVLSIESD
jgi:hypothetical protein